MKRICQVEVRLMSPGQPKVTNLMLTDESLMEMGGEILVPVTIIVKL